MKTLADFLAMSPEWVEPALWEETQRYPDGKFIFSIMRELGWQGGTIHQVKVEILKRILQKKQESENTSPPPANNTV